MNVAKDSRRWVQNLQYTILLSAARERPVKNRAEKIIPRWRLASATVWLACLFMM
jgi:hypothetical protein